MDNAKALYTSILEAHPSVAEDVKHTDALLVTCSWTDGERKTWAVMIPHLQVAFRILLTEVELRGLASRATYCAEQLREAKKIRPPQRTLPTGVKVNEINLNTVDNGIPGMMDESNRIGCVCGNRLGFGGGMGSDPFVERITMKHLELCTGDLGETLLKLDAWYKAGGLDDIIHPVGQFTGHDLDCLACFVEDASCTCQK